MSDGNPYIAGDLVALDGNMDAIGEVFADPSRPSSRDRTTVDWPHGAESEDTASLVRVDPMTEPLRDDDTVRLVGDWYHRPRTWRVICASLDNGDVCAKSGGMFMITVRRHLHLVSRRDKRVGKWSVNQWDDNEQGF